MRDVPAVPPLPVEEQTTCCVVEGYMRRDELLRHRTPIDPTMRGLVHQFIVEQMVAQFIGQLPEDFLTDVCWDSMRIELRATKQLDTAAATTVEVRPALAAPPSPAGQGRTKLFPGIV